LDVADITSIADTPKKAYTFDPQKDWITSSVFSQLSNDKQVDINQLASQLQVTANTITQSIKILTDKDKQDVIAQSVISGQGGGDVQDALKNLNDNMGSMIK
jgi:hypothetical protein